ncbi:MAG: DNA double-strand break repair nuclease NurA [Cyanobacteria bacterium P01_A01_bin.123]
MLDLMKIAHQMQGISDHLTQEAAAARYRVEKAGRLLTQALVHQPQLVAQLESGRDRLGFTAACPVEPLDTRLAIPPAPSCHTVIATDGSQISPSHHEIAYCYLINVGRIGLHYDQSRYPIIDNQPEVVYRPEDLYLSRQWGISTEEWMGHRRTVAEAVGLAELGEEVLSASKQRHESAEPILAPVLAMVDGSLIYWFLEQMPTEARDRILPPILDAWERLRQLDIPLVGYLSVSRSGEALNFLRLESCPYDTPDCLNHCPGQTDRAPCQVFNPLRDVTFWATHLSPGERSPIWRSSAPILTVYGEHSIYFCYVHVGAEVARVEMPAWVAENPTLLETALSLTLTQVQKGYGYPVTLAEAHNQAVVRSGDRARFFALLEDQMVRAGLRNVGTSYKEARKRGSIA